MWNIKGKGNHVAMVEGGRQLTYTELDGLCGQIVAPMGARSLVFCLCTNTIASVAGYLAFTDNGHVPLLLDAKISRDLLNQLIDAYRPAWVWTPVEMTDKLPEGRVALEL